MNLTKMGYRADLGSAKDIVQIAVHFKNVFKTPDNNLGTYDGVFQISSSPISYALLDIDASGQSTAQTNIVNTATSVSSSIPSTESGAVKSAEDWYNKGVALYYQGKYDEAIKAYDEAIRLDPNYAMAWYYKALVFKALGRTGDADAAYAKAQELDHDTFGDVPLGA